MVMGYGQQQRNHGISKPTWLQASISDLEQRFEQLCEGSADTIEPDSFATRAENYYQKRPQLLTFLHDLYNRYLTLADRYVQAVSKPQLQLARSLSQISIVHSDVDDADTIITDLTDPYSSDTDSSSMSFHHTLPASRAPTSSYDGLGTFVVAFVSRAVENEMLKHEVEMLERQKVESNRKMELQGSLVEVLESERMVLLSENARLGVKLAAITEENEGLLAEVGFMRMKAGELARCVVKLRDGHRVCILGRQIEALQAQIYGLEKRNHECYEVMARREEEKAEILRGVCLELERLKAENRRLKEEAAAGKRGGGKAKRLVTAVGGWFSCGGPHVSKGEMVSCGWL